MADAGRKTLGEKLVGRGAWGAGNLAWISGTMLQDSENVR